MGGGNRGVERESGMWEGRGRGGWRAIESEEEGRIVGDCGFDGDCGGDDGDDEGGSDDDDEASQSSGTDGSSDDESSESSQEAAEARTCWGSRSLRQLALPCICRFIARHRTHP